MDIRKYTLNTFRLGSVIHETKGRKALAALKLKIPLSQLNEMIDTDPEISAMFNDTAACFDRAHEEVLDIVRKFKDLECRGAVISGDELKEYDLSHEETIDELRRRNIPLPTEQF